MKRSIVLLFLMLFVFQFLAQQAEPRLIVYKTRKNYNSKVFITLSADKSTIVSYPSPKDVTPPELWQPISLQRGYLLDRRGINEQSVPLKLTFKKYASQQKTMTLILLKKNIADKDPFLEMCDCGPVSSYENAEKEINKIIQSGTLKEKCRQIIKK